LGSHTKQSSWLEQLPGSVVWFPTHNYLALFVYKLQQECPRPKNLRIRKGDIAIVNWLFFVYTLQRIGEPSTSHYVPARRVATIASEFAPFHANPPNPLLVLFEEQGSIHACSFGRYEPETKASRTVTLPMGPNKFLHRRDDPLVFAERHAVLHAKRPDRINLVCAREFILSLARRSASSRNACKD
jgi:hypothetical protein